MKNALAAILAAAFIISPAAALYADDPQQAYRMKSVAGKVIETDWVGSTMTIRWLGGDGYDEMSIIVPDSAMITRGSEKIGFGDVELSDDVYVEYLDCGVSGLKAVRVTVRTSGNS